MQNWKKETYRPKCGKQHFHNFIIILSLNFLIKSAVLEIPFKKFSLIENRYLP